MTLLKKITAILGASAILFSLASCAKSNNANDSGVSETKLRELLQTEIDKDTSGNDILTVVFEDFDDDGKSEMFALTGEESNATEEEILMGSHNTVGSLWFVTDKGASVLTEETANVKISLFKPGKRAYCLYEKSAELVSQSYVWGVNDGAAQEVISGQVGNITAENGVITGTLYANDGDIYILDGEEIYTYATEKPYYFYESDNGIKEYGGLEITLDEFLRLDGAQAIIDEIEALDYEITTLYYRSNGLININYKQTTEDGYSFFNSTVRQEGLTVVKHQSHLGTYAVASIPEIADYPTVFINS